MILFLDRFSPGDTDCFFTLPTPEIIFTHEYFSEFKIVPDNLTTNVKHFTYTQ